MTDRKTEGDPVNAISSRTWNSFVDAAEAHKERRLSSPSAAAGSARQTDLIHVRNDSGYDRLSGEVLALDGSFILDEVRDDYLWLSGVSVSGAGICPAPRQQAARHHPVWTSQTSQHRGQYDNQHS